MFIHFRCPGEDEVFDVMANAKLIYEVNNFIEKGTQRQSIQEWVK